MGQTNILIHEASFDADVNMASVQVPTSEKKKYKVPRLRGDSFISFYDDEKSPVK